MDTLSQVVLDSPIGRITVMTDGQAVTRIRLANEPDDERTGVERNAGGVLHEAIRQLRAYFDGTQTEFDLPIAPEGTAFQRRVWDELRQVRFGRTASYSEIARRIGQVQASRAVGAANVRNPIAIVIPCHRIVAADGTLGGYSSGLEIKRWLLEHEATVVRRGQTCVTEDQSPRLVAVGAWN